MSKAICSIEGCGKPVNGRGWCRMHYMRWYTHGDALSGPGPWKGLALIDRFMGRCEVGAPDECWRWKLSLTRKGYAVFCIGDAETVPAHRWIWEFHNGPIPEGMVIDHRCHNEAEPVCSTGDECPHRACVNPRHLVLATNQENIEASPNWRGHWTHCSRGHAYDVHGYISPVNGRRVCRACLTERSRERRSRMRNL